MCAHIRARESCDRRNATFTAHLSFAIPPGLFVFAEIHSVTCDGHLISVAQERPSKRTNERRKRQRGKGVQEAASDRNRRRRDISREANCKKFRADYTEATT